MSTISALKNGMSPSFIRPIIFHFLPLLTSVKEPSNNGLIPFFFLFITSSFFSFKKNHSKNKSAANLWPDPVHANNKKFMRDICDVFTIFFFCCLKGTIVHRPFYVLIFVFKKNSLRRMVNVRCKTHEALSPYEKEWSDRMSRYARRVYGEQASCSISYWQDAKKRRSNSGRHFTQKKSCS